MKVLLVNDDGIGANGLLALHQALLEAGHEVWTLAPANEKSGVSQAITAGPVLKVTARFMPGGRPGFAVEGTPADCACLGLSSLAPQADFVLSGINNGPNVGYHVNYSGTVGAAAEAARKTVEIMASWPDFHLPAGLILNVNFPASPEKDWRGLKWTGLSENISLDHFAFLPDYENEDSETRLYKRKLSPRNGPPTTDSDEYWMNKGYVTLTPLKPRTACAAVLETVGVN